MRPDELANLGEHQLLDVRLADDFEAAHLAGAKNNCVFEVAFRERLSESAPDASKLTVVYGANPESHEAAAAEDKLKRYGYQSVAILDGGLAAAEQAGLEIRRGQPLAPQPELQDGRYEIDLEESRLEWLGRNLLNKHWGTAALESGFLTFEGKSLAGGEFVVDLNQLLCTDLQDSELHDVLIAHLRSEDFFDVPNHPKVRFAITKAEPVGDAKPGGRNVAIGGDLTIRGKTNAIEFEAAAGLTEDGKLAAQAAFSIDRTRWGILYGSGKFFARLAGHLVNDEIEFQLKIVAKS